jgi:hypothetical protein
MQDDRQYRNDTEVRRAQGFSTDEIAVLYAYNASLQTARDRVEFEAKLETVYVCEVN